MTREEAIKVICKMLVYTDLSVRANLNADMVDACHMAIKALEQEPCEDLISRQAVLVEIFKKPAWHSYDGSYYHTDDIRDAVNSVKPQENTGHWIMKHRTHNEVKHYTGQDEMGETHTISVLERYEVDEHYCSECGKRAGDTSQNYCCACGAKMD